jgi:hypothetical protein
VVKVHSKRIHQVTASVNFASSGVVDGRHGVELDRSRAGHGFRRDDEGWSRRLEELVAFERHHGRLPRRGRNAGEAEFGLARWLAQQRDAARSWCLPTDRDAALNAALTDWRTGAIVDPGVTPEPDPCS